MSRTTTTPKKKQHGNVKYWNLENKYPIKILLDKVIHEVKEMNALEKNKNVPMLIKQIALWGTFSPAEAIGTLEIVKEYFIRLSDDENN